MLRTLPRAPCAPEPAPAIAPAVEPAGPPRDRVRRIPPALLALLGVCGLTVLALVLRLWGIDYALPQMLEDDGGVIVGQVAQIRGESSVSGGLDMYPDLIARIAAAVPGGRGEPSAGADLAQHLASAAAPHVHARRVVAWLSILSVPATWLLARRFLRPAFAFLAAALVASSLLFTLFAAESRPHAAAASLALLAVVAALRLVERADLGSYLLTGAAAGLALAALHSGIAVLLPIAAAHFLRKADAPRASRWHVLATLAIVALCFACFYPGAGVGVGKAVEWDPDGRTVYFFRHSVQVDEFNGAGFPTVFWSLWSFEPLISVLAVLGLVAWCSGVRWSTLRALPTRHARLLVVLLYVIPYLCAVGLYGRTYERFALQLVPFAACLAAYAALWIFDLLRQPLARAALPALLALLVLAIPGAAGVRLARLRAAPDPMELAGRWLAEHASARDERIMLHPLVDLPLARGVEPVEADGPMSTQPAWRGSPPWRRYQARHAGEMDAIARSELVTLPFQRREEREAFREDAVAYLAKARARYWVIPVQATEQAAEPTAHRLRAVLQAKGRVVARFPEGADGETDVAFDYEDRAEGGRPHWTASLLLGDPVLLDVIEVYELPDVLGDARQARAPTPLH